MNKLSYSYEGDDKEQKDEEEEGLAAVHLVEVCDKTIRNAPLRQSPQGNVTSLRCFRLSAWPSVVFHCGELLLFSSSCFEHCRDSNG